MGLQAVLHLGLRVVAARGEPGCHLSTLRGAEGQVVDAARHGVEASPNHTLDQDLIWNLRTNGRSAAVCVLSDGWDPIRVQGFGGVCLVLFSCHALSFQFSSKLLPLLTGESIALQ